MITTKLEHNALFRKNKNCNLNFIFNIAFLLYIKKRNSFNSRDAGRFCLESPVNLINANL